jgi:hypothetical protein
LLCELEKKSSREDDAFDDDEACAEVLNMSNASDVGEDRVFD